MTAPGTFTAIVLAGSRRPDDPVAAAAGVAHKALAIVDGQTMLGRVLDALTASGCVARIIVVVAEPFDIDGAAPMADLARDGTLTTVAAAGTPSLSVSRALERGGPAWPYLVTTADHALLTPEMVRYFCDAAIGAHDVAVGLTSKAVLETAYPKTSRTYLRFADDGYSGCNLFALMTPLAGKAPEFWRRVEAERKKPWRLIRVFGLANLLRYLLRRLDLDGAMERASAIMGMAVHAVRMPFAEAAIDVDKPEDLALAGEILRRRRTGD